MADGGGRTTDSGMFEALPSRTVRPPSSVLCGLFLAEAVEPDDFAAAARGRIGRVR
jgi:hypothetical protein